MFVWAIRRGMVTVCEGYESVSLPQDIGTNRGKQVVCVKDSRNCSSITYQSSAASVRHRSNRQVPYCRYSPTA